MSLQDKYKKEIIGKLKEELKLQNIMAVPRLSKIVLNSGLGESLGKKGVIEAMVEQFTAIAGQKPVVTHAKRAIANYKLQKGDAIGVKVTLRGKKMYDFYDKLVSIVLPRVRDFRGVKLTSFDKGGNYSIGFPEQIVFPEIEYSKVDRIRGMEIVIVTTATKSEHARKLLEFLGMPFAK
ncbi:MAG: 50S ribosomal protein L5 [Candidatus Gottesmanbacteria bacterium GW2011_GWA2_41_12]|uniref:Large ribosomal subunit protein uL5 n=2 Tax=Candidatus Gottesmaniibacteriota TaxID=1752720 RepID=A0A0G0XLD4_9BACT|nr:MAG: 50S ribosomal protein L5 [Candidatus Gottesmanbacteria bacterium GW2011_GWC2_39_8]KKR88507.1 MAG: 50S ribosomal protein L5 [Candidatus Gottesmanbacteria bacterium GW2011_GWA2_41_12]